MQRATIIQILDAVGTAIEQIPSEFGDELSGFPAAKHAGTIHHPHRQPKPSLRPEFRFRFHQTNVAAGESAIDAQVLVLEDDYLIAFDWRPVAAGQAGGIESEIVTSVIECSSIRAIQMLHYCDLAQTISTTL